VTNFLDNKPYLVFDRPGGRLSDAGGSNVLNPKSSHPAIGKVSAITSI